MPTFITKTDLQRSEYFRQLDSKEGNKVLTNVLLELKQQKQKKTLDFIALKGLNSRFQRQMNRITQIRNFKNKKYRNKWNTVFHQELAKFK